MADGAITIENRDELRAWLENKPPDWAQVIAARVALRVLPLVYTVSRVPEQMLARQRRQGLILAVFRANFISWAARRYPAHEMRAFAVDAIASADNYAGREAPPSPAAASAAIGSALAYVYASDTIARAQTQAEVYPYVPSDAAAFAADAVADAADAADAAAAPAAAPAPADIWRSISVDAAWLETGFGSMANPKGAARSLAETSLWLDHSLSTIEGESEGDEIAPAGASHGGAFTALPPPSWAQSAIGELSSNRALSEAGFSPWIAWYRKLVPLGQNNPSSYFGETLDIRIATQPNGWWDRGAEVVNAKIAEWLEEEKEDAEDRAGSERDSGMWDFFISYAAKDETAAREIDAILQNSGHSTYVQFRDFSPGSNLVREMQHGLTGAGRVIALYSPEYERSEYCQAEWSAAYNMDPGGAKRKLLPFMLRPTELNPLARQIVYKSLVGLSPDGRRKAVLEAIEYRPQRRGPGELKKMLAEVASPEVTIAEGDRIDAGANRALDVPMVDDDLIKLPQMQRTIADTIRESLPGNAPAIVPSILGRYRDHLAQQGTQPIVGLIQQLGAALRAEFESEEFELWGAGVASLFGSFFGNHELLIKHFPLAEDRERVFSETDVDEDAASGPALSEPLDDLHAANEELSKNDQTTPEFDKTLETLAQIGRDMASLPAQAPSGEDPPNKITPKKRYILGAIGFLATLYGVVGATASIAATPAGAAFLRAVAEAIEKLMQFVTL